MRLLRLLPAALLCACARTPEAPAAASPAVEVRAAGTCAPEYEPLPGGACLAVPPGAGGHAPVVLYLHGMYDADAPEAELGIESRVARAALARGFAVLAPRGEIGACDWSLELARWRCWPRTLAGVGQALVAMGRYWGAARERLGLRALVPHVMGHSNGGYFASAIAAEARMPFASFAILHGGAIQPANHDPARARPTLLVAAEGDEHQKPRMDELAAILERRGWPFTYEIRPGGHALTDGDIARALDFFERARAPAPEK